MANVFYLEPIDGGDTGIWGSKELRQNRLGSGLMAAKIYDDSGTLKISKGRIHLDDDSGNGVVYVDTITTVDISGVTNSRWFTVEVSRTGTTPSFAAVELADANPYDLPTNLDSYYDPEKGGYYRVGTARIIGLGWKATGGSLAGIVNVESMIEGYAGYSTGEVIGHVYRWDKRLDNNFDDNYIGELYLIPEDERPSNFVLDAGTEDTTWTDVDFSAYVPVNVKALLLECFLRMTGDGARDVEYLFMRKNGSSETNIYRTRVCSIGYGNAGVGQNIYGDNTLPVKCDSNGIVEYKVSNSSTATAYATIFGYYI